MELGVDMEKVKMKVIDCGNVNTAIGDLERTHLYLQEYLMMLYALSPNSIVIVIGGSDDLNLAAFRALPSL